MFQKVLFTTITALASAQDSPSIGSRQNELVLERTVRQEVNAFELSSSVATLNNEMSLVKASLEDQTVNQFLSDLTASTITAAQSMATENAILRGRVSNMEATLSSALSTAAADAAAERRNMEAALSSALSSQASALNSASANMSTTISTLALENSVSVSSLVANTQSTMSVMNTTLTRQVASAMPGKRHYWQGGCSNHRHGGWNWVCHDRVRHNTATPYFRGGVSGYRFQALQSGIFRLTSFTINRSCSWAHNRMEHNGRDIYTTHGHPSYSWYQDIYINAQIKANANDWWAVRAYAACGHLAYYAEGTHGRIESSYQGLQ